MKALIFTVFIMTGLQLCIGYQTTYDDVKRHNFTREHAVRKQYFRMVMGTFKEGEVYMRDGTQTILKSRFCAPFEVGYVYCSLQDRYRRMVDKYRMATNIEAFYLMEEVMFLTDIELEYWTIDHIVNGMHQLERKYLIFNSLTDPYKDTLLTRRTTASLKLPNMSATAGFEKKRRGSTKTRSPKLKFSSDFFHRYSSAATKSKGKRFWWPIEYGWEIDWEWNDEPNFKKDIEYHMKSDVNFTVTAEPSYEETERMDKIIRDS